MKSLRNESVEVDLGCVGCGERSFVVGDCCVVDIIDGCCVVGEVIGAFILQGEGVLVERAEISQTTGGGLLRPETKTQSGRADKKGGSARKIPRATRSEQPCAGRGQQLSYHHCQGMMYWSSGLSVGSILRGCRDK